MIVLLEDEQKIGLGVFDRTKYGTILYPYFIFFMLDSRAFPRVLMLLFKYFQVFTKFKGIEVIWRI